jgi:hypothetical protein
VFLENLEHIQQHNQNYNDGYEYYTMGVDEYMDMDFEEFERTRTGAKILE